MGFGITSTSKTDLVKMILAEFGLLSSNDWFLVPLGADVGSLTETRGIVVTDTFGFRTYVEPTARRHAKLRLIGNWGMWNLTRVDAPNQVDDRLFLAPAVAKSLETPPVSEVLFLRDEMANLVWGVETVIPDALGGGRDGSVAAKRVREAVTAATPPPPVEELGPDVLLRYSLMGTVPENWFPFVSVTLADADRSAAFLQGGMPRIPPLAPPTDGAGNPVLERNVVLPRGGLLSRDPVGNPNVVSSKPLARRTLRVSR